MEAIAARAQNPAAADHAVACERMQARPAYERALAKGGAYSIMD